MPFKYVRPSPDRTRLIPGRGYVVSYFVKKHGITKEEARQLLREIGNDRAKLNAAAVKLKEEKTR